MRFGSIVLVLALPLAACGDSADKSVNGVFPSSAFLGRKLRVEVSGDNTNWKAGTSVDFGAGVTVQNVAVASPTTLFADVTILDDAAPGLRDVTVGKDVLKEAFQLESAITLKFRGTVAQGSIATFSINNHDFDTPFDDTATGDGFFTPLEYTNTFIDSPAGTKLQISSITAYTITGTAFFDLDAAPGPITVNSGLDASLVKSALGEDVKVEARTATALTAGAATPGMVSQEFASNLYEFTPTGSPVLATIGATSSSQSAQPGVAILPASGKFDDMLGYAAANNLVMMQPAKLYAIYFDNGGGYGYNYSIKASSAMMTPVAEAEPNNTTAQAPVASAMPYLMTNGSLSAVGDVDWIAVNLTAAEVGKKIHVKTTGNDPYTDTVVEVFKPDGTTSFGGPSSDQGFLDEKVTAGVPAAGKYFIKITASQDYFMDSHNQYAAAVWLE